MQGIYTYIPETNYVPREYSVAAILLLLFMVVISLVSVVEFLYFYISTFRSICAVPNMAVFCSSFTFIIISIIIIIISFMQCIYTYIPETNYVPREYSVAAILLLFTVLISLVSVLNLLYFYISTFRSVCAVPNMAVLCSSFTSYLPGMLLTYFLNDFEIVPVAPIITGIIFAFTFHMRCISIVRSLYFRIFSASFLITFLFPEISTSIYYYYYYYYHNHHQKGKFVPVQAMQVYRRGIEV